MLHALMVASALTLTGPQVGAPAPDFSLTTTSGKPVSLAAFRSKTLVVNVWATWCPPCREETSTLISAAKAAAGPGEVVFLGVDSTEAAPISSAELPVWGQGERLGYYVLEFAPGPPPERERLLVAVTLADQVGAAFMAQAPPTAPPDPTPPTSLRVVR